MPGLTYFVEEFSSFIAAFAYYIMLFISICTIIIKFECYEKKAGRTYSSPFVLILSATFILLGIASLIYETSENRNEIQTTGYVVGFSDEAHIQWPVISFSVNGVEYTDTKFVDDVNIGDKVTVYCRANNASPVSYYLIYHKDCKYFYIPAILVGVLIGVIRFRKNLGYSQKK